MKDSIYKIKSEVWLYPGMAGWHFITVPKKISTEIKDKFNSVKRGWGSLPVEVTIKKTKWKTSIFPDKKSEAYILPLKSKIRNEEGIKNGDEINFSINIRV